MKRYPTTLVIDTARARADHPFRTMTLRSARRVARRPDVRVVVRSTVPPIAHAILGTYLNQTVLIVADRPVSVALFQLPSRGPVS